MDLVPGCAQEEKDREEMLRLIRRGEGLIHREPGAHFTASSWIVDEAGEKVLAVWHNIYRSWSWTGGHLDGCSDPLETAVREAREETGIKTAVPWDDKLFSLEILTVDGHEKRGVYVPSHLHLNMTFLLKASAGEETRPREGENRAVKWFLPEDFLRACDERWMAERVYRKLIRRFETVKEKGEW
ncbi:MAG: NUDIX hydrolase [Clostridia bacterium]|nr:NUDIX hydrolase [Clostridia bacterium]